MHFHDSKRNVQCRERTPYGKIIIRLKNTHIYGKFKRMSSIRRFVHLVFLLYGINRETRKKEQIGKVVHFKIRANRIRVHFMDDTRTVKKNVKLEKPLSGTKHKPKQNIELKNFAWEWTRILLFFCFCAFSAIRIFCVDIKMSKEHLMEQNVSFFQLRNFLFFYSSKSNNWNRNTWNRYSVLFIVGNVLFIVLHKTFVFLI